ncbi:MAG: metal ABC transporter permease [Clostridia bacterium]|nr:metal ABC transporter permease [Clostridia bacterium]
MMGLRQLLSDPYISGIIWRGLAVGGLVSLCAALLGVTLVLKRFAMIGDGLSHVGFGAVALSALLGLGGEFQMEFALPIVTVASFLLLHLTVKGKLKGDAAIAVISSSAMAVGVIIYHANGGMTADACNSLFGSASVITLSQKDLLISTLLSVTVMVLFMLLYHRIFSATFDPVFAAASGVAGAGYQAVIALLTSVTVVVGMKMMGAVMISALIIFPALTAMRLCKSFKGVVLTAAGVSLVCFVVGFIVACVAGLPTGPCVVVVNLVALLAASFMNKR